MQLLFMTHSMTIETHTLIHKLHRTIVMCIVNFVLKIVQLQTPIPAFQLLKRMNAFS